jgi:septal ring-binding cell division protein DamX
MNDPYGQEWGHGVALAEEKKKCGTKNIVIGVAIFVLALVIIIIFTAGGKDNESPPVQVAEEPKGPQLSQSEGGVLILPPQESANSDPTLEKEDCGPNEELQKDGKCKSTVQWYMTVPTDVQSIKDCQGEFLQGGA